MNRREDLTKQRDELERQIAAIDQEERGAAVAAARALISAHKLTKADLFDRETKTTTKPVKTGRKVPMKYANPLGGEQWSGRGHKPLWIKDKDETLFLIKPIADGTNQQVISEPSQKSQPVQVNRHVVDNSANDFIVAEQANLNV